jgi:hypothetical protein
MATGQRRGQMLLSTLRCGFGRLLRHRVRTQQTPAASASAAKSGFEAFAADRFYLPRRIFFPAARLRF